MLSPKIEKINNEEREIHTVAEIYFNFYSYLKKKPQKTVLNLKVLNTD